jgi:hypothetical protein|tara:strand:- start:1273 stop:1821 length:549 start_codon:yes stop_codon:yes gene_type:complete
MTRRVRTLEEISKAYQMILVDTSALISPIGYDGFEIKKKSADFFARKFQEICRIGVTESVKNEYANVGSSSERKLMDELENRTLQLNGGERLWYEELSKLYSRVRSKFDIGDVDFDFLLSGIVVSEARKKSVALISNDTKMVRPWKFLLFRACLTPEELGFFIRKGEDAFKGTKFPKEIKSS